jgi:hypothetical protein
MVDDLGTFFAGYDDDDHARRVAAGHR